MAKQPILIEHELDKLNLLRESPCRSPPLRKGNFVAIGAPIARDVEGGPTDCPLRIYELEVVQTCGEARSLQSETVCCHLFGGQVVVA